MSNTQPQPVAASTRQLLERAETFISGFEDDSGQAVGDLLQELRAAIAASALTEPAAPDSRLPSERFLDAWLSGTLPLPVSKCSSEQLYRAFRRWCAINGERWPETQASFGAVAKQRHNLAMTVFSLGLCQSVRVWVPAFTDATPSVITCLECFEVALAGYLRQPVIGALDVQRDRIVFAAAPAQQPTQAAADALLKRARTGIATNIVLQGHVGDTFDFWQGYAKGVRDLMGGSGARLAAKDAASSEGYQPPGVVRAAVEALDHDVEGLNRREIAKFLAKAGVKLPRDFVAHFDVVAAHQLEDSAVAAVDLHSEHAALGVVKNDGAGLRGHESSPFGSGDMPSLGESVAQQGQASAAVELTLDQAKANFETAKEAYSAAVARSLRPGEVVFSGALEPLNLVLGGVL